jgi:hypothetical protein
LTIFNARDHAPTLPHLIRLHEARPSPTPFCGLGSLIFTIQLLLLIKHNYNNYIIKIFFFKNKFKKKKKKSKGKTKVREKEEEDEEEGG